ncbi:MAG TPA: GAF domain-containing sensor histidine kinase [Candidatus Binatia bacterium]|jgi:signal transduction histidine kinase
MMAVEASRLLIRRLRGALLASVIPVVLLGMTDLRYHPDVLASLLVVKLAQLMIAIGGWLAISEQLPRRRARIVSALVVSAAYATVAVGAILRQDGTGGALVLLTGVLASAVLLPWGAVAQLATVAAAGIATLGIVAWTQDAGVFLAGQRTLALGLAFAGSILIAYEHARQRNARDHVAATLAGHTAILERIMAGAPLDVILTALVEMVERHADGMLCSVLLRDGDVLRAGAAPSLPADYRAATDGVPIGPDVGSCGTAAYRGELVVVVDIANDPRWVAYRDIALAHGLRACWSAPILARDRSVLGTLAMYYSEPRPPDADDLALIETAAHLAGVAIERSRGEEALAISRRQREDEAHVSRALVQAGHEMLTSLTTPVVLERLARLAAELLDCDCADTVVRLPEEDAFVTGSAHGYEPAHRDALERVRFARASIAPLLASLTTRSVIQIRTAAVTDPEAVRLLRAFGITTSMYVALRRGDDLIGFLSAAYRGREEPFSDRQQRIAVGVAQLASMALENARLVEETKRASQLKTEFVSTMSHELRTPLSVIMGYTDMLADDAPASQRAGILAKIRGSSLELLDMIEATLNVNRLDAGKDQPIFERLSVPALIEGLASDFAALPHEDGTVLRWEPAPAVAIRSDRRKLRMVLKNLVGNALKFTPRGEVVVACVELGETCAFTVRDTGVGIAPAQLPVIFDMFRQGDSSDARSYGGVGLGLYIVRRLVTQLGGDVTVRSELGRGTAFTVTVPLAAEALRVSA